MDESGGTVLAPGDWRVGDPFIKNTRPGVDTFYAARAGLTSNMFTKMVKLFQTFFKQGQEDGDSSTALKQLRTTKSSSKKKVFESDTSSSGSESESRSLSRDIEADDESDPDVDQASSGDKVKFVDIF